MSGHCWNCGNWLSCTPKPPWVLLPQKLSNETALVLTRTVTVLLDYCPSRHYVVDLHLPIYVWFNHISSTAISYAAGVDYVSQFTMQTFTNNIRGVCIDVSALSDDLPEDPEFFEVVLATFDSSVEITRARATAIILDGDCK